MYTRMEDMSKWKSGLIPVGGPVGGVVQVSRKVTTELSWDQMVRSVISESYWTIKGIKKAIIHCLVVS